MSQMVLYESWISLALFHKMSLATVLQLGMIYSHSAPSTQSFLEIEILSVQQQEGILDCGLFGIANVVDVCLGNNPENVQYDLS